MTQGTDIDARKGKQKTNNNCDHCSGSCFTGAFSFGKQLLSI